MSLKIIIFSLTIIFSRKCVMHKTALLVKLIDKHNYTVVINNKLNLFILIIKESILQGLSIINCYRYLNGSRLTFASP